MKHAELVTALQGLGDTLSKVSGETTTLLQKVADLQTAVDNADDVPQDVVDAVAAVTAQAKAVDDLVPDASAVPTPEEPAV